MEPSTKVEDIRIFLDTHVVDVLAVIEAGLHHPGYKILLLSTWSHHQQAIMFCSTRPRLLEYCELLADLNYCEYFLAPILAVVT